MNLQDALGLTLGLPLNYEVTALGQHNVEVELYSPEYLLTALQIDEHHCLPKRGIQKLLAVIPGVGSLFDYAVFDVTWIGAVDPGTRPYHLIRFSHRRPTYSAYFDLDTKRWILEDI